MYSYTYQKFGSDLLSLQELDNQIPELCNRFRERTEEMQSDSDLVGSLPTSKTMNMPENKGYIIN